MQPCVDDLDDDLLVREADDQAVLRGIAKHKVSSLKVFQYLIYILLVLRLGNEPLTGVVYKDELRLRYDNE